eukprot:CAMPEP_0178668250 /NCGR_PEP_ID=MMETSP0698-20121128/31481_1 /TAXON_ID=265572 /ORGANISM="Extubocellulus spinifer, Strain CCMP396" /LENGTH=285 /DNA_ID=CAMNT_0020311807 /DNA_START=164 /DNA_END=1019 /DNA_ORIENTATION=-
MKANTTRTTATATSTDTTTRSNDDIIPSMPMPMRSSYTYEITGTAAHSRIVPLLPSHWVDVTGANASGTCSARSVTTAAAAAATTGVRSTTSDISASSDNSSSIKRNDGKNAKERPEESGESKSSTKSSSSPPQKVVIITTKGQLPMVQCTPPSHEADRDSVAAYSHLPNGTDVLDDKWVLARLLGGGDDGGGIGSGSSGGGNSGDGNNEVGGSEDDTKHANTSTKGLESHCFRGPDGFAKFCGRVNMFNGVDTSSSVSLDSCDAEGSTGTAYAFPDLMEQHNKR